MSANLKVRPQVALAKITACSKQALKTFIILRVWGCCGTEVSVVINDKILVLDVRRDGKACGATTLQNHGQTAFFFWLRQLHPMQKSKDMQAPACRRLMHHKFEANSNGASTGCQLQFQLNRPQEHDFSNIGKT